MPILNNNQIDKVLRECAPYRNSRPEAIKQELLFEYEEYVMDDAMLALSGGAISKEQFLSEQCEIIAKETEICNKVREAKLEATFDSKGKNELQVMVYMIEETQRLINEKFGIDALSLSFAKVIRNAVKYKTPFNMIKEMSRYVWWTDLSGVYSSENFYGDSRPLTVQELVEYLMREDRGAVVTVGDLGIAKPLLYSPSAQFIIKDDPSGRIIFEDDFHENIADKMQKVVIIDGEEVEEELGTTTPYTKCFASSRGSEKETIKWMFKNTQFNLSDHKVDIMPLLKTVKDYPSALAILRKHANWIDLDGKY